MYIAIDIGGTKTIVSGFSELSIDSLIFEKLIPTGRNYSELIEKIFTEIDQNKTGKINGIGISHVGEIDKVKGECNFSSNLPEFMHQPIRKQFEEKYKTKVVLENDLVCGSIAEAEFGYGKNYKRSFYFTASTGIGGGFVYKINGQRFVEQAEIGHWVIKGDGLDSPSGQIDILESYVGGRSMEKRFLKRPEDIDDLLIWEQQVKYIAVAIVNSIVVFNPEVIILGGSMILNNEYVKKKVIIEVKDQLRAKALPIIKISEIGKQVVVYGALALLK